MGKKKLLRNVFIGTSLCVSSLLLSGAPSFAEEGPLTEEQKAASLSLFEQATTSNVSSSSQGDFQVTRSAASFMEGKDLYEREAINKYLDDGKYVVRLVYPNTSNYPIMYGRTNYFQENKSQVFYEQTTDLILKQYLGGNYGIYEPTVQAVTDIVSITAKFTTVEQLETLFEHPELKKASHIGDYGVFKIVLID